jgi:putative nucleotidyltransferase with HDIG domain
MIINQLLNKWIHKPTYFRLGFVVLLIFSATVNSLFLHDGSFYFVFHIFYIFSVIYLGVGFYNKPTWFLVLLTSIVVIIMYALQPKSTFNVIIFFMHLLAYLLITSLATGLMKYVDKANKEQLELTTALANALDSRDTYTSNHSENVAKYAVEIARRMGLSDEKCQIIHEGGLLHDIGKIGIPENILTKPDMLTNEEYDLIKSHPKIGYDIIKHVSNFKGNGVLDVVLYHHERYDGSGYPKGLKGEDIPLNARIVAIADSFDAMTSKRVYRTEQSLSYSLNEILNNKGTQFDPELVDIFLSMFEEHHYIEQEYQMLHENSAI